MGDDNIRYPIHSDERTAYCHACDGSGRINRETAWSFQCDSCEDHGFYKPEKDYE